MDAYGNNTLSKVWLTSCVVHVLAVFCFAGAFGRANVGFGCYPVLNCFDLRADCADCTLSLI